MQIRIRGYKNLVIWIAWINTSTLKCSGELAFLPITLPFLWEEPPVSATVSNVPFAGGHNVLQTQFDVRVCPECHTHD